MTIADNGNAVEGALADLYIEVVTLRKELASKDAPPPPPSS